MPTTNDLDLLHRMSFRIFDPTVVAELSVVGVLRRRKCCSDFVKDRLKKNFKPIERPKNKNGRNFLAVSNNGRKFFI
jgi:hypothetical protein